jgi:ParB family chromosome partitioning protein
MNTQTVALDRLRPGHAYPGFDINMRKSYSDAETAALARSIRTEGVLQSLLVCPDPNGGEELYVVAGGRRWAALDCLRAQGNIDGDELVPVIVRDDIRPQDALAKSLIENDMRVPPHPVDRYETFSSLREMGLGEEAIADRFSTTLIKVQRALALGDLSPTIRAAWRAGEITAEAAAEFTPVKDHAVQDRIFEQLKKQNRLWPQAVHNTLRGAGEDLSHLAEFVGVDDFVKAGGVIDRDLFKNDHIVQGEKSIGLLKAMVNDRLDSACLKLKSDGWSWALPASAMPADWQQWAQTHLPEGKPTDEEADRIEKLEAVIKALNNKDELTDEEEESLTGAQHELETVIFAAAVREASPRQKKKSGCVVDVDRYGKLNITYGLIRPSSAKDQPEENGKPERKSTKAEAAAKPEEPKCISNALASRLSIALTQGARDAIVEQPDLALAVLLAGFASNNLYGPVRVQHQGLGSHDLKLSDTKNFESALAVFAKRTVDQNLALLAHVVGAALDFEKNDAAKPAITVPAVAALCDAIPGIDAAVAKRFDRTDFFESAPKPICLAAIEEACGKDAARS